MDFLLNELSFHGQFHAADEFARALDRLMAIRAMVKTAGLEMFASRALLAVPVFGPVLMPEAVQSLPFDKRRAWLQWLTRFGPHWQDVRRHSDDDYLEADGKHWLGGTALGEAAFCRVHGLARETVSAAPSEWLFSPVNVIWSRNDTVRDLIEVPNHWAAETVSISLRTAETRCTSWNALEVIARRKCNRLVFADDAFVPLAGHPFAPGAAERIQILLAVLNTLKGCFDDVGQRTAEGHRIYRDYFGHEKACFSDSSESEKSDFARVLLFPHPDRDGERLFCTWHGKIKSPQLRIHFSWPIARDIPLYVVYVGPKITKR